MMKEFKFTSMPFVEIDIFVKYLPAMKNIGGFTKLLDIVPGPDCEEVTANSAKHNTIKNMFDYHVLFGHCRLFQLRTMMKNILLLVD